MRKSKLFAIMLFLTLVSSMLAKEFGKEDYRIYKSTDGKEISLKKMAKELSKYDVIFFGEWHDDALLHQLEADILPLLDKKTDLAISMEMFERDVQSILNDFLDGKISEEDFLKKSRAWGNYPTDYKPIIEYAKKKKLDVLAANVPRRYAALVSKQGGDALNQLSEDEKPFVARELKVLDNQYKKQFMETMAANMGRKRKKPVTFWLSENELSLLKNKISKTSLTRSDYLRKCSLNKDITVIPGIRDLVI